MNFFKRAKSPAELVAGVNSSIKDLSDASRAEKATKKISVNIKAMKDILYGDGDTDPKPDLQAKLATELMQGNVPVTMLQRMDAFEFEAKKDCAQVFNYLLRHNRPMIQYVKDHKGILEILIKGYENSDNFLNCGSILRECIRHMDIAQILLPESTPTGSKSMELFNCFFDYVQKQNFDIASDAFLTFKSLLTKHKKVCATFLVAHYDEVFDRYNQLIQSDNYVTKRQSLKLLGEILLDRANFSIMIKYINNPQNLKILMNLLRGKSKTIQFEAFHVFKVFVANPKKSEQVLNILLRNKTRLIEFLERFQKDKDDEQFTEEKGILLDTLRSLESPK